MGWFARLTGRQQKAADPLAAWLEVFGGLTSKAGVNVTWKTALEASVSLACGRVIGEGLAQVPFQLKRKRKDGRGTDVVDDHPLSEVVSLQPTKGQTSYEFRETGGLHMCIAGNAYAFKNMVTKRGGSQVRELIQFAPGSVTRHRKDDGFVFVVDLGNGAKETFPQEVIWHLRGPSWSALNGLDGLSMIREALGLSVAAETAAASLHKNGVSPSGTYSVEGNLTAEQHTALLAVLKKSMGAENAGMPLILDRNAKFLQQAMKMTDAQAIETRRFQVEEVCRAWRVMPIMIGHADKTATYASAEQMFLAHVVHTMGPHYARVEQSAAINLLSAQDRDEGLFLRFNVNGLLRGAAKDRAAFYKAMSDMAALNPNEIRAYEDLNPYDGGDTYRAPVNTAPADAPPVPPGE